jgi:hypothetical protein
MAYVGFDKHVRMHWHFYDLHINGNFRRYLLEAGSNTNTLGSRRAERVRGPKGK